MIVDDNIYYARYVTVEDYKKNLLNEVGKILYADNLAMTIRLGP